MIVDSSAIIAIALKEPEAELFATAIIDAPVRYMSSVNWLESIVIEARSGVGASDSLQLILKQMVVEMLPMDSVHAQEAHEAWRRYGKGRHPTQLSLGDCCAYAASKVEGLPLLFKGGDFDKTDVQRAQW